VCPTDKVNYTGKATEARQIKLGPNKKQFLVLNELCFWTLSIVWCLKKKTKLRN